MMKRYDIKFIIKMVLIDIAYKNRYIPLLLAVIVSALLSGGISWHYLIIPAILLIIVIAIHAKEIKFNFNSLVIIAILLSGMISISHTLADKQNAIHEFLKIIVFALAFYTGTATDKKMIIKSIGITGAVVAVFGILGYCNILRINEFVFNDRTFLRLQSFIKYANTTAVMLGCSYFALIKEYEDTKNKYILHISACVLLALYLTISKAAIPLFLLVGMIVIMFDKKYISSFALQNIICILFAIAIILLVKNHYYSFALLTVTACIVTSGVICKNKSKSNIMAIRIMFIIVLILGICSVCILAYMSDTDIFITLLNRLKYSKDALQLLKDNWMLGIGAGGWKYYQYKVQSLGYSVNYIHNGWLQIWLDYGVVGFITFVALFIESIIYAIKKKEYILLCIISLIAVHSLIDMDFSFGVILIIYGMIIGYLTKTSKQLAAFRIITAVSALTSVLFVSYACSEYVIRSRFENEYLNKNYEKSLYYAYQLEKICPFDSELKVSIAALRDNAGKENLEKAIELSPLDKDIFLTYINYMIDNGYKINIEDLCEHLINLAPKQESIYAEIQIFAKKAFENSLCSIDEYDNIIACSEQRRKAENVLNRNELLNEIAK